MEVMQSGEENVEESYLAKYPVMRGYPKKFISDGWKVHLFGLEVCMWWYAACSLRACLASLGFIQKSVKDTVKKASDSALRCSFWMPLKRMNQDCNHREKEGKSGNREEQ